MTVSVCDITSDSDEEPSKATESDDDVVITRTENAGPRRRPGHGGRGGSRGQNNIQVSVYFV